MIRRWSIPFQEYKELKECMVKHRRMISFMDDILCKARRLALVDMVKENLITCADGHGWGKSKLNVWRVGHRSSSMNNILEKTKLMVKAGQETDDTLEIEARKLKEEFIQSGNPILLDIDGMFIEEFVKRAINVLGLYDKSLTDSIQLAEMSECGDTAEALGYGSYAEIGNELIEMMFARGCILSAVCDVEKKKLINIARNVIKEGVVRSIVNYPQGTMLSDGEQQGSVLWNECSSSNCSRPVYPIAAVETSAGNLPVSYESDNLENSMPIGMPIMYFWNNTDAENTIVGLSMSYDEEGMKRDDC